MSHIGVRDQNTSEIFTQIEASEGETTHRTVSIAHADNKERVEAQKVFRLEWRTEVPKES
jgi:hypothetical protein